MLIIIPEHNSTSETNKEFLSFLFSLFQSHFSIPFFASYSFSSNPELISVCAAAAINLEL